MVKQNHISISESLKKRLCLSIILLIVITGFSPAQSQTLRVICQPRPVIVEKLWQSYQETPVGGGLNHDGSIFEIYASESGSWTLVKTLPDGLSCPLTVGKLWRLFTDVSDQAI